MFYLLLKMSWNLQIIQQSFYGNLINSQYILRLPLPRMSGWTPILETYLVFTRIPCARDQAILSISSAFYSLKMCPHLKFNLGWYLESEVRISE